MPGSWLHLKEEPKTHLSAVLAHLAIMKSKDFLSLNQSQRDVMRRALWERFQLNGGAAAPVPHLHCWLRSCAARIAPLTFACIRVCVQDWTRKTKNGPAHLT